jgi:hypothetical protein
MGTSTTLTRRPPLIHCDVADRIDKTKPAGRFFQKDAFFNQPA